IHSPVALRLSGIVRFPLQPTACHRQYTLVCWNPPIVTSYLVVHKDQILCKRYCKLGRRTLYSGRQQQRGSPYYKSQYEHG
ncbi:MAG: hypothetical protein WAK67_20015, partial [Xanthobacteraceae bacterium]